MKHYLKSELYELIKTDESIFDFIQEGSLDGLWYWDLENPENEWMNPKFWTVLGYNPDEMPHKSNAWQSIINSDDLKIASENFTKHCENSNHPYDQIVRYTHKNGSIVWIRCRGLAIRDKNGKAVRMLGAHHNISEIKNAELLLKEKKDEYESLNEELKQTNEELYNAKEIAENSEEKYRALYNNAPLSYQSLDENGCFIDINPMWSKTLGYDRNEVIGKWYGDFLHPDYVEHFKINFPAFKKRGYISNVQFKLRRKDNTFIYVSFEGCVGYTPEGKFKQTYCVFKDISEQKALENAIIKAKEKAEEANRLKTEFLKNMSHEIRTPMNGIIGFSEMLDRPDISEEKRKYFSKIVQNSSQQLLRIIDDILEISILETKQEKLNESEFSLNDLLMGLFSIFSLKAKERNIPIYLKKALHDSQSLIATDQTKLVKILSNLLENALKYTNQGLIEFGYFIEKPNLVIYVKDNGIGISRENHEIIFERFFQEDKEMSRKYGGLGLGLSISKENAQLLGGDITLESEKGKGSTFYVSIPYKPVQAKNMGTDNNFSEKILSNDTYTILVAEDEEVNFLFIEALFENAFDGNYELIHAKNGKDAVDICTKNNHIDLVLMDIKMPIMDGHEATEKIKKTFPNLPIIAQTAYSTETDKKLALKHGCDDFISKPINRVKLFEMILRYQKMK